jgi:hypothetical protein
MNRDDIIRMAREAGLEQTVSIAPDGSSRIVSCPPIEPLERFANLVAAAERERIKWDSIHTCNPHCDRPACVAVRRAREDEREMCAKVCEAEGERVDASWVSCAAAIRARGQE